MKILKPFMLVVVGLLFTTYIGSYLYLSRRGFAEADRYEMAGFYYFFPEDSDAGRRKEFACRVVFWPLNIVDRSLGFGRHLGAEPLWGLSK